MLLSDNNSKIEGSRASRIRHFSLQGLVNFSKSDSMKVHEEVVTKESKIVEMQLLSLMREKAQGGELVRCLSLQLR